jgi:predicted Ser/Thr protein kinase
LAAVAAPTESDDASAHRGPPPALAAVAAAFPQLEILELIGQGGMGAVYRARQRKLDRQVALKLLAVPAGGGGTFAERFHREARLLARLNHPGVVAVHDYGEAGGFFYLLMEYVDGVNLRQAMRAGRFTPGQALALVPKICEALQYAHDEGILHRDIKPENLLLDTRGRVKIADFGIAKLLGDQTNDATLTASGLAVGTPHYMAPEQLEHPQDVDQRADIYSLGVVFYEMLTGELPIGRFAPPSRKTPVDPRVDEVVLRALEKERERRQHNVTEVKTEVEQIAAALLPPAGAAAPSPPAPASAAAGAKTALCYVSTPEHLRTFRGRYFYIYQGNGQLRLDERSLSYICGWQRVTIPLGSIRALTLGRYALAAKPAPLDYLEVTFLEGPASRTLLFTPTLSGQSPVWETNRVVAEWATAVHEAVQAATGRTIELNRCVAARGRYWNEVWETYGLTAGLCTWPFLLLPILLEHRAPTQWKDWLLGPLVATVVLASLLLVRWLMERRALQKGNLSEVTALPVAYDKDDPILLRTPGAEPEQPAEIPAMAAAPATTPGGAPRFSWMALASAVCSMFLIGLLGRLSGSLGPDGLPPREFNLPTFELAMLGTGGFLGLGALWFGTAALRAIRASRGRLRGARLAATGLLAIPAGLMVKFLPPWFAFMARAVGWQPSSAQGEFFTASVLVGVLLLSAWGARRLRQWVRQNPEN